MVVLTCQRCNYIWDSNTITPASCPRCKTYWWNKDSKYKKPKEEQKENIKEKKEEFIV